MPVTTKTTTKITCDNPNCPGNELPVNDLAGWTVVVATVYPTDVPPGFPTMPQQAAQQVYCCAGCASAIGPQLDEWATV